MTYIDQELLLERAEVEKEFNLSLSQELKNIKQTIITLKKNPALKKSKIKEIKKNLKKFKLNFLEEIEDYCSDEKQMEVYSVIVLLEIMLEQK